MAENQDGKKTSELNYMTLSEAIIGGTIIPVAVPNVDNFYMKVSDIIGCFGAGNINDAASITVRNNSLSTLTTAQTILTLNVDCLPNEVPNFAVEINTTATCTVTVTKTTLNGNAQQISTLKYSAAGGNVLDSGKTYQLTCVGTCWTVAEFVDPTSQQQQSTPVLTGGLLSQGGNGTLSINDNPLAGGGPLSLQTTDLTGGELGSEEPTQATVEGESA